MALLDLTQGEGVDSEALLAGLDRDKHQLLLAASIDNPSYSTSTGSLSFRTVQTEHSIYLPLIARNN